MDPDRSLVCRLERREGAALREAYERHGTRVQRLCVRLLGCTSEAEDATQEVFLRLFERASTFDGRARFSTWLYRLTVNLCLQRLEKERLRHAAPLSDHDRALVDPGDSPPEVLARSEARLGLERLLARLSGEHRTILVLRELEGLSYRQIAEALELAEGTVMSRLARARGELVRLAHLRPRCGAPPVSCPLPKTP